MKTLIALSFLLPSSTALAHRLVLEEPAEIQTLDEGDFNLGAVLFSAPAADNKKLLENAAYNSMVADLEKDLEALKTQDAKLGVGMNYVHRLFDIRWLKSPAARFELVGVVNRMDRTVFNPGTCGEVRLIYRLSYAKTQQQTLIQSRLPMTLNAVFKLPAAPNCQTVAKQWSSQQKPPLKAWVTLANLKSLEVNLQAVRWPSTIRGDMGGHAEYFLRVYKLRNKTFVAAPMENTPDVARLQNDSSLRTELLNWISKPENIKALDAGTLNIPEKFLTSKSSSFALHGMNRLANRPFDQIFKKEDFKNLKLTDLENIYGPSSFRRRLNDLSCAGCHQGRTIAGFHFLGKDPESTIFANSVFSSQSPHMMQEQKRRQIYFQNIFQGKSADSSRPFSERDPKTPGSMNAHCGLPGSEYQAWTCAAGLKCMAVVTPDASKEIGECLPEQPMAGNPCEPGTISQTANSHRDQMKAGTRTACPSHQYCQTTKVGFPGGMCSGGCEQLTAGEACGAIAILQGFNDCLARNRPFGECLAQNTRPAGLQACDDNTSCRADYICNKTQTGKGVCIPPYFLFQLRVDGHPKPI